MARLCVIDESAAIRETMEIVLGARHDISCVPPGTFATDPAAHADADVYIIGDGLSPDALAAIPPTARVLWLRAAAGASASNHPLSAALPRWFTPADLNRQVEFLLARSAPARPTVVLPGYPLVTEASAALVARAARTRLPALICGEPGTGKLHVARSLHVFRDDGCFLSLAGGGCIRATLETTLRASPASVTLYVPELRDLERSGQHFLRELLMTGSVPTAGGDRPLRLVVGSTAPPENLAADSSLDASLFFELAALPILLAPLRDRSDEIPDLLGHFAPRLARDLGKAPVAFTAAAVQRLQRYLWFGNLAEFKSVLARTIALADGDTVDAADLRFASAWAPAASRPHAAPAPGAKPAESPAPAALSDTGAAFGLVVNELAHEFRNPMVTIKTVAQHLGTILEDKSGHTELKRLTGDAVERMDRAIENLLQFTRFGAPRPEAVSLRALLSPALIDLRPLLVERQVKVDYQPGNDDPVLVDAAQIAYALDNVLRTVLRELGEGETLQIRRPGRNPEVEIGFPGAFPGVAEKLEKLIGQETVGGPASPGVPLGLFLARVLIQRNGGALKVATADTRTTVTVTLPASPARVLRHAETSYPRR